MQMTDLSFLLFFLPLLLLIYYALYFSVKARNAWLVVCSLFFYTLGNYIYLPLLVLMVALNYFLGLMIHSSRAKNVSTKTVTALAVALNLLPLFIFRYLEPLLGSLLRLFEVEPPAFPAAPIGIAFLALQGISYVVDLSRGKVEWNRNPFSAALYLIFFPFLTAGPLLRYHMMAGQIEERKVRLEGALEGGCRFVVGLAKLILLGNPLLNVADIVFERSANSGIYTSVPIAMALLGLAALLVGIYHYLSGYSDLVIGLGGLLGFTYPENFRYPVIASSISSFWKRCYASLLAWFEEYVFKPLEKKQSNNDHMVLHLLLMWLLIGLWIGPGIPKIIFGMFSFVSILIERIVEVKPGDSKNPIKHLYVLCVVLISLVALKTTTLYQFSIFIGNLFGMRNNAFSSELTLTLFRECWPLLLAGFIALTPIAPTLKMWAQSRGGVAAKAVYALYPVVMLVITGLLFLVLAYNSYQPNQVTHLYLWR